MQDLKVEMDAINITQTEGILEMENPRKRIGTKGANIGNMRWERMSHIEDTREEIDISDKENVKSKKFLTKNIQEIWDTMKRPNIGRVGIYEIEESQLKGSENIFNKIIEEKHPKLELQPRNTLQHQKAQK